MSGHLIDSNVLLDVAVPGQIWQAWSARAIAQAHDHGGMGINSLIYAEVSIGFESVEEVERVLPSGRIARWSLPWEAAFLAGKVYLRYRRDGGLRRSPVPDFYIGAHAAVSGLTMVTRDPRRYRRHFPRLALIAPDTHFQDLVPA